jgi:hypothetical protein
MDQVATTDKTTRRVGVIEGLLHMPGAALGLVVLARPFGGWMALTVMALGAFAWVAVYAVLRAMRVRAWFGAWDVPSFVFVWGYAVVLALAALHFVLRSA